MALIEIRKPTWPHRRWRGCASRSPGSSLCLGKRAFLHARESALLSAISAIAAAVMDEFGLPVPAWPVLVRERQRPTAALASTSWLLRSTSGDGVDSERVIAIAAKGHAARRRRMNACRRIRSCPRVH